MLRKTKFWPFLFALILLFSLLSGCTGQKKETPKEGKKTEQKAPEAKNKKVILATTTSTVDSGLLDVLKPEFEKKTGYRLTIVSVGSGQAIAMAEKGEADALLVHSPKDEKTVEGKKIVVNRQLIMHNDFLLVGPANDPAKIKGKKTEDAFKAIANTKSIFISRGDESGTHKKELGIWEKTGIKPSGDWYQSTGTGMGQTLNIASEKGGYTLTDRATYLAQKKNNNLAIMVEGDKTLLNIYHAMQVNPEKFNKVNVDGGKAFVDFMTAKDTQDMIKKFGVDKYGQSLFIPDAGKKEEEVGK